MCSKSALVTTLMLVLVAIPAVAQETAPTTPTSGPSDELAAIRAASETFVSAFNKHDAKAVAAHWTEDGKYIDDSGRTFEGREAIAKEYGDFFAANPDAQMRIVIDSLRILADRAAIEEGRAILDPPPPGAPAMGKYMAEHVKVDGKWLMSRVSDARIEAPSAYGNVADLEFLIGTWTAEEHGVRIQSVCRWVANKSFVQRNYTVTHVDGTSISGVQMIGWNAEMGHVQSWDFSPDGGHAVGIWSPKANGWAAEVRGVTGDGVPTSAVNLLTRLDDNAYVWQSVNRIAGETALPDTDEVVIKRSEKIE